MKKTEKKEEQKQRQPAQSIKHKSLGNKSLQNKQLVSNSSRATKSNNLAKNRRSDPIFHNCLSFLKYTLIRYATRSMRERRKQQ